MSLAIAQASSGGTFGGGSAPYDGSSTWAARGTGSRVGAQKFITDIAGGTYFRWDGTNWRTVGTIQIAGSGAAAAAHTGTLTKTTIASFTLPGGMMTATGVLRIEQIWSVTNSANSKLSQVDFGGTSLFHFGPSGSSYQGGMVRIQNRGSVSSQIGTPLNLSSPYGNGVNSQQTAAVNTASDVTVAIAMTLANVGDSATLEAWSAMLSN